FPSNAIPTSPDSESCSPSAPSRDSAIAPTPSKRLIFTAATAGILASSLAAERLAEIHARGADHVGLRHDHRGIAVLLALDPSRPHAPTPPRCARETHIR